VDTIRDDPAADMSLTYDELSTSDLNQLEQYLLANGYPEGTRVLRVTIHPSFYLKAQICIMMTDSCKKVFFLCRYARRYIYGLLQHKREVMPSGLLFLPSFLDAEFVTPPTRPKESILTPFVHEVHISEGAWATFVYWAQQFDPELPYHYAPSVIVLDGTSAHGDILVLGQFRQQFSHHIHGRLGEALYFALVDLMLECLDDPLYIAYFDGLWFFMGDEKRRKKK
jgi:hypothetical protein